MADGTGTPPPPEFPYDWTAFQAEFKRQFQDEKQRLGRVNIIVAGNAGVGKSTLLNAIFSDNFAKTATGSPVTKEATLYTKKDYPIGILDTRGLESEDFHKILSDLDNEIVKRNQSVDALEHIHIAWVCISSIPPRVEKAHRTLIRNINKHGIPVIVIATQYITKSDFPQKIPELISIIDEGSGSSPKISAVIPIRAMRYEDLNLDPFNLDKLVDTTFSLLPDAARNAFASAQKIDLDLKFDIAKKIITYASTSAFAAGGIAVIPDTLSLIPIQVTMIVRISTIYGVKTDQSTILALAPTVIGCALSTFGGRFISKTLLDLVPGVGWVINGGVAATITSTFGFTYAKFIHEYMRANGEPPTADVINKEFPKFLEERKE